VNVIELKYQTPTGVKVAYAFLDAEGYVVREKGLNDLAANIRGGISRSSADTIKAFLDLTKQCPDPKWEDLRRQFASELQKATASNCTKCTRASISRKYAKMLYERNL
jgi:hypothetical protein